MFGSVNKVILVGNLGNDSEVRQTTDGKSFAVLQLATSESWIDRETEKRQSVTEWHRIVIYDERLVEVSRKYLKKGAKVFIEGQLKTRKWKDNEDKLHFRTEIVLRKFGGNLQILNSGIRVDSSSVQNDQ